MPYTVLYTIPYPVSCATPSCVKYHHAGISNRAIIEKRAADIWRIVYLIPHRFI
jgi:hypothetical protein